ncbi:ABC transporter substrate-binding protein [Nocardiopsis ansamitocini]|uniref:Amino acid ABC transporter, substrate-binding protein n=1 Tax=Nocardiopsis ansamitocini TaxID=1670832 RepID=A0A9W6P236_9ACTN|nr:ABC transporter substrate-binding protein [Nocardiopsis ansamitocini]GLU45687.1 putative amino acid ABC transporter, substrate-binding protein [Nocardiopsis ansamitocini]
MSFVPHRRTALPALAVASVLALSACGGGADADAPAGAKGDSGFNTSPDQDRIRAEAVPEIAALVPEEIRETGALTVGHSSGGAPPLTFYADDDETFIGVETDIAQLVSDVLDLEMDTQATSWENLFLSVESGQYDVAFANVTVTEERKDLYDFATYRVDTVSFETAVGSDLTEVTEPADIAGLSVAVDSGTNQEEILLRWDEQNQEAGLEPLDLQYYQNATDYYLALQSGRIDVYLGPTPSVSYHAQVSGETELVGTISGGGEIKAEIAAMTLKDNGLIESLNAAINSLIETGEYQEVLDRWAVDAEAVSASEINPPGLPRE